MINNAGSMAQAYAISVEHILCNVFDCERHGFGGIVDSDYIRKQPYSAMTCGLSYLYANDRRPVIIRFIEDFYFYNDMSLDVLLSFEGSTKVFNGITIEINYKNGKELVEDMIEKFRLICRQ